MEINSCAISWRKLGISACGINPEATFILGHYFATIICLFLVSEVVWQLKSFYWLKQEETHNRGNVRSKMVIVQSLKFDQVLNDVCVTQWILLDYLHVSQIYLCKRKIYLLMVDEMCSILHEKYPKNIWHFEYWMPVMVIECMDNIIL